MTSRARLACAATLGAALALAAPGAAAHPLGNFTVNRFSALQVSPREVAIAYVVDMAEIPTFQQRSRLDGDRDGDLEPPELRAYAARLSLDVLDGLDVEADGHAVELAATGARVQLSEGQGGLDVLRAEMTYAGALPSSRATLTYVDRNYTGRIGWREIVASGRDGEGIVASSVPSRSVSDALRSYPKDLLQSPLDVARASIEIAPGAPATIGKVGKVGGAPNLGARDVVGTWFSSLIEREPSPSLMVVAVLLSLVAGALHALGPGHGKTVMAAYLVGADGGVRHAVGVGVAVSLMHTASVVALGLITLWASSLFPPEAVLPWLSLASGLVVLALGLWLLRARLAPRRADAHWHSHARGHGPHDDAHHSHGGHHHAHAPRASVSPFSARGMAAVALSGGLLPSPAALIVLLGAVALHRIAFGVVMVGAFSIGLAAALTVVGALLLKARDVAARRLGERAGAVIPVVSAAAIVAAGLVLTTRAALGL